MIQRKSPMLWTGLLGLGLAAGCTKGRSNEDDGAAAEQDQAEAAEANAEPEAAEANAEADAAEANAEPEAEPNPYKKGQVPPKGMTPEQLRLFAKAQGDPLEGQFTLEQALAGDEKLEDEDAGQLHALFETTMGDFECRLFEDKTPKTVANFVGLARGVRPAYDKKKDEWTKEPYYDGVLVHRVVENFMLQTGDRTGSGTGHPGYVIEDEIDKSLRHDKPGRLSMANRGPNTGSSQFFITVRPTPHLDGKHAVFGQCEPKVPKKISKVKVDKRFGSRPVKPVEIEKVTIVRK